MNSNNKNMNDNLFEDISDDKVSFVKPKNAEVPINGEFEIEDVSFDNFNLEGELESNGATSNLYLNPNTNAANEASNKNNQNNESTDINNNESSSNINDDTSTQDNNGSDIIKEPTEDQKNSNNQTEDDSSNDINNENNNDLIDENQNEKDDDEKKEEDPDKKDDNEKKEEDPDKKDDNEKKEEDLDKKDDNEKKEEDPDKKDDNEKKEEDPDKKDDKEKKEEDPDKKDDKEKKDGDPDKKDDKNKNNDKPNKGNDLNKKDDSPNKDNGLNKNQNQNKENDNKQKKDESENKKNDNQDKNKGNNNRNSKNNDNKRQNPFDKKKNDIKNKWDNRPKNLNDVKKRTKDGLKNKAKESFDNSNLGKTINKGKEVAEKTKNTIKTTKKVITHLIKYWKVYLIGLGIAALFLGIIILVAIISPGTTGDVNEDGGVEKYSDKDQETLEKLRNLFNEYPNADGTVAFATIVLPYYDTLIDASVKGYLTYDDEKEEQEEEEESDEESDSEEDVEESDDTDDDLYLKVFRKKRIRNRLEDLLKELSKGEDSYKQYLKDEYLGKKKDRYYLIFKPDFITGYNGYKKMFKNQKDDSREDELKEAIIDNIYDIKDKFINYVFESMVCSSNATSLGTVDTIDLSGDISVIIKDSSSGTFSEIKASPSLYQTDDLHLSLKRYVMGVAYSEIGLEGVSKEASAKADMIAAQSFVLGRTGAGCSTCVGMGYQAEVIDGKTVFYMRGNTYDQDFCDVYEGCQTGSKYAKDNITQGNNEAKVNVKGPLSGDALANLEKWYDEIANEFIYDEKNNQFAGSQLNECEAGSCLNQKKAIQSASQGKDYKTILFTDSYNNTKDHSYVLYDKSTASISAVSSTCTGVSNGACGIASSDFIYYSQKVGEFSDKTFCHRTDEVTIKSSGCGVTSMAMVIANLTNNNVTPLTTNEEAYEGGFCGNSIGGTNAGYFSVAASKYGLSIKSGVKSDSTNISDAANDIISTIRSGGLVIINVNSSWLNGSSGHYIVAKSVDDSGNLIFADPYADSLDSPVRNNIKATEVVQNYVNNGHGWYMFTSNKSKEIVEKYCNPKGKATGYLGNPVDPNDTTTDFYKISESAQCFPKYCSGSPHSGFDLNASNNVNSGDPVYAMDGGTVSSVGTFSGNCYGNCTPMSKTTGLGIEIDHGNGYHTAYYHFSSRPDNIKKGVKVAKGELIGYVGNTGNSSGAHLHITLRNDELYSRYGWNGARGYSDRGLMNAANYINKNKTYVGKTK